MKRFTRRETLQGLGMIGVSTLVTACGGGGNGSASTATPGSATATRLPATASPTAAATATTAATAMPTATVTAPGSTPTGTAQATDSATRTATEGPPETATPADTPTSTQTANDTPTSTGTPTPISTALPTDTPGTVSCVLSPEQTEGPFYLDLDLLRSDIREDRTGALLRITLLIVDADGCTPIPDALVNIWHADAGGVYSGFAGQLGGVDTTGLTFLRGYQVSDGNGRVEFVTIYPGWYPGRAVHIHLKVHLDSSELLTSQMYFDDSFTDVVYLASPYSSRGERNTRNADDNIFGNGSGETVVLDTVPTSEGYAATLVIGVAG